jgi:hypothetical protein
MFSLTILVNQKDDNYTRTPSGLTIWHFIEIFDPLNNKTRRVLLRYGSLLTLGNREFCYFFRIKK